MSNEQQPVVYKILIQHMDRLEAEIAVLNKRAAKLGSQPAVLTVQGEEVHTHKDSLGIEHKRVFKLVTVVGEAPKYAGWTLVAAIERQESGENLVSCVPGQECPVELRSADTHCDHCNTSRRRKEVFILRHDDGHHVQVGRQCIADFLGGASPEGIVNLAAWGFDLGDLMSAAEDEGWGCGSRGEPTYGLEQFVKTTAVVIRKHGWVSRTVAQQMEFGGGPEATVSRVMFILDPPPVRDVEATRKWRKTVAELTIEDRDIKLAEEAIAWATALPTNEDGYLYNLGVAVRLGFVRHKTSGIVASLVAAYQRKLDKEDELNMKKADTRIRSHVGVVGERMQFPQLTIKSIRSFDSDWGVRTMIRFEDAAGNILVFWKSGDTDWEEGVTLDITATVKKHEEYRDIPQTVIQRAIKGLSKLKKQKAI